MSAPGLYAVGENRGISPQKEEDRNYPTGELATGVTEIVRDIKNNCICRYIFILHEILTVCKPFFKKNKDSLVQALECVYIYINIYIYSYLIMKIENQRAKLQPITKNKHRLKANIQLLFFRLRCLVRVDLLEFSCVGNTHLETVVPYSHGYVKCLVSPV